MMGAGKLLKDRLKHPEIIIAPGCYDALSARAVAAEGFEAVYIGGYAMGQALGMTEPLMTMCETVTFAEHIVTAVDLPVIVDAATGFGDLIHCRRTVREFVRAGVGAIHIEDQVFPKRARYFENHKYVITRDEAIEQIQNAVAARGDDDLLIIARTDAREAQNGGFEEALERCLAFAEAGADIIMPYNTCAPNAEEAALMAQKIPAPLLYVNSEGKVNHARLSARELEAMGWRIVIFNIGAQMAAYRGARDYLRHLKAEGASALSLQEAAVIRNEIETSSGLPAMYQIERQSIKG